MKKNIKDFYETSLLKEGLKENTPEIAYYLAKEEDYLLNKIKKEDSVIEIGCGSGRTLSLLKNIACRLVGIDFTEYQVSDSKKNAPHAEIFLEDVVKRTRFEDNSFDYVLFMYNTFGNLIDDKLPALHEAKRIVKPNGVIIISVYAYNILDIQLKFYQNLGLNVEKVDKDAVYLKEGLISERFKKPKLQNLIQNAGLYCYIKNLTPFTYLAEVKKIKDYNSVF